MHCIILTDYNIFFAGSLDQESGSIVSFLIPLKKIVFGVI
ncbi:MAG: hypothetical protein FD123_1503 [Bacteroidetes bacterium]|nr:MAG: hypothetical protein FD123_1503 [Bacteroidota bacterium]